jgi:hypothetical protein
MGTFVEDLWDHEGYADRRLADGRLAGGIWSRDTLDWTGYVAACGCGWCGSLDHPPTEEGEQAALDQWRDVHAEPMLARQAQQRRAELTRLLRALGDTAEHLDNPAQLARIGRAADHLGALTQAVRGDLERQTSQREADGGR